MPSMDQLIAAKRSGVNHGIINYWVPPEDDVPGHFLSVNLPEDLKPHAERYFKVWESCIQSFKSDHIPILYIKIFFRLEHKESTVRKIVDYCCVETLKGFFHKSSYAHSFLSPLYNKIEPNKYC